MPPQRKRARRDSGAAISTGGATANSFAQVSNLEEYRMSDMADCEVYYVPSFISDNLSLKWYADLLELDSWYQPKLKMYGREITQSRKIAAYASDPELTLKYSGQTVDMKYDYPPVLREIQDQVEKRLRVTFNHVMLNLYENGKIYIGNHRDNLENKVIASVSLGAPRTFIMTHDSRAKGRGKETPSSSKSLKTMDGSKTTPTAKRARDDDDTEDRESSSGAPYITRKSWLLQPGSLLVMQGDTQKYWKHEIPKEPKVTTGRISLTFRQLVTS
ncbi:hypothetical protein CPC08DRAFT_699821 [Agrocybe pediades]|nr:hypothetical protein CPC08DRAFT_699821 [Agrocybe pediades]